MLRSRDRLIYVGVMCYEIIIIMLMCLKIYGGLRPNILIQQMT